MKRVYHHHSLWEEGPAGMWRRNIPDENEGAALRLMRSTEDWGLAMKRVTTEWRYSCEQNLSHTDHNRVAWLGQAAVCLYARQPAEVTKRVWWQLSESERAAANRVAAEVIEQWEGEQCQDVQLELMLWPLRNSESS